MSGQAKAASLVLCGGKGYLVTPRGLRTARVCRGCPDCRRVNTDSPVIKGGE